MWHNTHLLHCHFIKMLILSSDWDSGRLTTRTWTNLWIPCSNLCSAMNLTSTLRSESSLPSRLLYCPPTRKRSRHSSRSSRQKRWHAGFPPREKPRWTIGRSGSKPIEQGSSLTRTSGHPRETCGRRRGVRRCSVRTLALYYGSGCLKRLSRGSRKIGRLGGGCSPKYLRCAF